MQIRRFPRADGTQESLGPFPFALRGIILINRTDVDVFATDDSGYEYFCPPNVIATWSAGNTTRFLVATSSPATNGEAVTFIATDEATANSTSQLATLSGGSAGTVIDRVALADFAALAPVDQELIELVVPTSLTYPSATEIRWLLRYDSSSLRWYKIGGPPLRAGVLTDEAYTAASGTVTDLSTVGPRLTVPVGGRYRCEWGARPLSNSVNASQGIVSLGVGAAGLAHPYCQLSWYGGMAVGNTATIAQEDERVFATSDEARMRYYAEYVGAVGNAPAFRSRWLELDPIYLG